MKLFLGFVLFSCFIQSLQGRPALSPSTISVLNTPSFLDFIFGDLGPRTPLVEVSEDKEFTKKLREFGNYSASAYCSVKTLQTFGCSSCFPRLQSSGDQFEIVENKSTGALSYVRYHSESNTIVVAFRGTANLQNWQYNAKISTVSYRPLYNNTAPQVSAAIPENAAIHRGFWQTFESMKDNLTTVVQTMWNRAQVANTKPPSIATTGHSLGGALAGIAALHFQQNFNLQKDQIITYTLSQPRVGNAAFAQYYDSLINTVRVTNGNDPIVHVPGIGFEHFGTEIYVDFQNRMWLCPGKDDERCSGQFDVAFNPAKHSNIAALGFSTSCE
ncbi:Alpha/Beta hydrolase protein [Paraphysoderma sedebokerense]|nr:Alpha/Beta hydrolase protein [Paraphysoderma sedebokerense]